MKKFVISLFCLLLVLFKPYAEAGNKTERVGLFTFSCTKETLGYSCENASSPGMYVEEKINEIRKSGRRIKSFSVIPEVLEKIDTRDKHSKYFVSLYTLIIQYEE